MPEAVLLYDGDCPLCRGVRDWVARSVRPGTIEFVSCQSQDLHLVAPEVSYDVCMEAIHLILPGRRIYVGEQAFERLLPLLRGKAWLRHTFKVPGLRFLARLSYRYIARHRQELSAFFLKKNS